MWIVRTFAGRLGWFLIHNRCFLMRANDVDVFTSWSWFSNIRARCERHLFGPFSMFCPILGKRLPATWTIEPSIEIVPNKFSHRCQRRWPQIAVRSQSLAKIEQNWRICQSNMFSARREKDSKKKKKTKYGKINFRILGNRLNVVSLVDDNDELVMACVLQPHCTHLQCRQCWATICF